LDDDGTNIDDEDDEDEDVVVVDVVGIFAEVRDGMVVVVVAVIPAVVVSEVGIGGGSCRGIDGSLRLLIKGTTGCEAFVGLFPTSKPPPALGADGRGRELVGLGKPVESVAVLDRTLRITGDNEPDEDDVLVSDEDDEDADDGPTFVAVKEETVDGGSFDKVEARGGTFLTGRVLLLLLLLLFVFGLRRAGAEAATGVCFI